MGGRRLRLVAAAVALGFVFALVLGAAGVGSNAKAFGAGTTLTIISGDVTVRHGVAAFTVASDGEVLNEGDAIRTGADGRAVLTYFEGSTVTIEPATELAIDAATATADGSTVVLMTQNVGRTWHVVTKLIAGNSKYEVRTPASTASVRGTEFQVDADNATTTVSTTEGTVIARVIDPASAGALVDVPVTAGTTQTQPRNAPPAPARIAPEPERKVTVTVGASNTLVVDPLGRSNGVTKDGKVVVQTPGAQVKRDGNTIVVTLPNLPDGKLAAHVDRKDEGDDADVTVQTKVEDKGGTVEFQGKTTTQGDRKTTGFEITRDGDGKTKGRALDDNEKQTLSTGQVASAAQSVTNGPNGTRRLVSATPTPTRRASGTRVPSATPNATRTPSPSPVASSTDARRTPERTATPRPTQTPRPQQSGGDRGSNGDSSSSSKTVERPAATGFVPARELSESPGIDTVANRHATELAQALTTRWRGASQ